MPNDQNQPPHENSGIDPVARHNARRYALQAMYQWQVAGAPISEIEHDFITSHIDRTIFL